MLKVDGRFDIYHVQVMNEMNRNFSSMNIFEFFLGKDISEDDKKVLVKIKDDNVKCLTSLGDAYGITDGENGRRLLLLARKYYPDWRFCLKKYVVWQDSEVLWDLAPLKSNEL